MKILIEGGDLNPPFVEGTRNIVKAYTKELKKRGHNIIILTKRKETNTGKIFRKFETNNGVRYYRWSNYLELFLALKKIKKEKIDLVHIFAKGLRPVIYLKFIRSTRIPIVFTLLGYPFESKYRKNYFKKFVKEIDQLTVTSKTIFEELKNYEKNKIVYLPFGIETEKYSKNFLKKEKKTKIICLRNYLLEVLKAFKKIKKENRNVKLIISNIPKEKHEKEFIEKNELKKDIIKIGLLEDMSEILCNSPIMLELNSTKKRLPSASPPLLMLEAMASGARIVATDIPELREVIENKKTGILIKENTKQEIYGGIKEALKNKAITKNAMKKINLDYNIKKIIKSFERIYNKLMTNQDEKSPNHRNNRPRWKLSF